MNQDQDQDAETSLFKKVTYSTGFLLICIGYQSCHTASMCSATCLDAVQNGTFVYHLFHEFV